MPVKFKSEVSLDALNNATIDTDKFLVSDSGIVKYRTGTQLLSDLGIAGTYVPYTGATGNVDLGTHTLSSYNLIVNHTSGSGVAASITKGGSGEALTINKTSGSGNAMSVTGGLTSLVDLTLSSIANATTDTDRFIVSDSGAIKYRTGAQVLSDIGGQPALTNPITGTGTTNYIPKFTGTTSLGDSQIFDNGTNVGIGSATPGNKLSIFNTLGLPSSSALSEAIVLVQDSGSNRRLGIGSSTSGQWIQSAYPGVEGIASNLLLNPSGGNIGIGTTTPDSKLDVTGGDITVNTSGTGFMNFKYGSVGSESAIGTVTTDGINISYNASSALTFGTAGTTERMRITSGGNVGIGTSSPTTALEISNVAPIVTIQSSDATQFHGIEFRNGGNLDAFIKQLPQAGEFKISNGRSNGWGGYITLYTDTAERMRITSGGNVGIGTSSPSDKLTVQGTIAVAGNGVIGQGSIYGTPGNSSYGTIHLYNGATGNTIINNQSYGIDLHTAGSSKMYITQAGNVGIGTVLPKNKLHVSGGSLFGSSNATVTEIKNNEVYLASDIDGTYYRSVRLSPTNYSGYIGLSVDSMDIASVTGLPSAGSVYQNLLNINGYTGNVGIGTTSPGSKLDVNGDIGYLAESAIYPRQKSVASDWYLGKFDGGSRINNSLGSSGDNAFQIGYYGGGTFAPNIKLSAGGGNVSYINSGNVGIGTTSPAAKLDVRGGFNLYSDTSSHYLEATSASDVDGTLNFRRNGGLNGIYRFQLGSLQLLNDVNTGEARFFVPNGGFFSTFYSNGVERMRVATNGNVGIGTSSPQAKLQVSSATSDGIIVSTTANVEPFIAFWRNSASNGVGVLRLIDGGSLYFDNGATGAAQSTKMQIAPTGSVRLNSYGSGTFTGTATQKLAVDSSGNIIEIPIGAGPVDGSGTTNYVTKWTDADTIGNSQIFDNGTNVGIGTLSPSKKLDVVGFDEDGIQYRTSTRTIGIGQTSGEPSLYWGSGTPLTFFSGSELMRITSGGNVGIGTSSPSYKLHVVGEIYASSNLFGNVVYSNTYRDQAGGVITLQDDGGSVGIGTSSPGRPLTVASSNIGIRMDNSSNSNAGLEYYVSTGIFHNWLLGAQYNVANTFEITPSTTVGGTTYSTPAFVVNANGNVGIGTSSPSNLLHLSSSSSTNFIVERTGSNGVFMGLKDSSGSLSYLGSNNGDFLIQTPGSGYSTKLTVLNSGNVGIGTTSPSRTLHVLGQTGIGTVLKLEGASGTTTYLQLAYNGATNAQSGYIGYDSSANMGFFTNDAEKMRIDSAGNVGIGTSSPARLLELSAGEPTLRFNPTSVSGAYIFTAADGKFYFTPESSYVPTMTFSSGNVGIGTSSSGSKLQITAAAGLSHARWTESSTTVGFVGGAEGIITGVNGSFAVRGENGLVFSGAGNSTAMYLNTSGNLGIGTTAPIGPLTVSALGNANTVFLLGRSADNATRIDFYNNARDTRLYTIASGNSAIEHYADANIPMVFSTNATERMRITAAGNVGINCGGLNARLEVVATSGEAFRADVSGGAYRIIANQSGVLLDGDVGIGTTTPSQKLDVVGNAKVSGSVQVGDDSTTASAANVGATRYRSDSNNSYMDMVMQTGASTYAWVNVVQNNW